MRHHLSTQIITPAHLHSTNINSAFKMTDPSILPCAKAVEFGPIVIQPPLTRYGSGPGLFILRPAAFANCQGQNQSLDPEPLQKWAEEGFSVAQITLDVQNCNTDAIASLVSQARRHLFDLQECTSDNSFGLIGELDFWHLTTCTQTDLQRSIWI